MKKRLTKKEKKSRIAAAVEDLTTPSALRAGVAVDVGALHLTYPSYTDRLLSLTEPLSAGCL